MGGAALSLEETFLAHLAHGLGGRAIPSDLRSTLDRLFLEGSAAWGALDVLPEALIRHVAARIPLGEDIARALDVLRADDLYLACACTLGASGAAEAFERTFEPVIRAHLRRSFGGASIEDEVEQALFEKVLVGAHDRAATIALYSGRGPLSAWLKIAAYRLGLNLLRSEGKIPLTSLEELANAVHERDPELDLLRARYGEDLRTALDQALNALTRRERMLVLLAYVEGVSHAQIGVMYSVHQTTISRQLLAIREQIVRNVQRAMRERAGVEPSELVSIVRLLGSQIDLSLSRWLVNEKG